MRLSPVRAVILGAATLAVFVLLWFALKTYLESRSEHARSTSQSTPAQDATAPARPPATPVADVSPIDTQFRNTNANEVWFGWVHAIHIDGDLLVVQTTLDMDNDAPGSTLICEAAARAVEAVGTQGIDGIAVESMSGATLAGKFEGMAICKDYE